MLVGRLRRVPEDSASGASRSGQRPVQDWRALLAIYAITALIESTGVSQVFAFLPLRLHEIGLPDAEVASFTGIFTALIFVFGIFLVPFWGVWADKYRAYNHSNPSKIWRHTAADQPQYKLKVLRDISRKLTNGHLMNHMSTIS